MPYFFGELMEELLNAYQRGNRDGLIALAKWADSQAKIQRKDYEKFQEHIGKNSLTGLRYEMTATHSLIREETYRTIANQARRMAESLPIDPTEL